MNLLNLSPKLNWKELTMTERKRLKGQRRRKALKKHKNIRKAATKKYESYHKGEN